MKRIAEVDGLRAVAALSVFAVHAFAAPVIVRFTHGGWAGVDLFFVISGYLITSILLGMRDDPEYFKNFYMRRTLRIFPPYYAFFLICFVGTLLAGPHSISPRLWLTFLLYGTSLTVIRHWFAGAISHVPVPMRAIHVTWSLSIEELFYLLWAPAVRFLKERQLLQLIAGAIVIAPIVRWGVRDFGGHAEYYFFPARFDSLAFGALLAILRRSGKLKSIPGYAAALSSLITAFLLIVITDPQEQKWFAIIGYSIIALNMTVLLAYVLEHAGSADLLCRVLRSRVFVRVGTISYMFYLLHLFVLLMYPPMSGVVPSHPWLGRTMHLMLSFFTIYLLAELSWKFFETPILRLKSRFESQPVRAGEEATIDLAAWRPVEVKPTSQLAPSAGMPQPSVSKAAV